MKQWLFKQIPKDPQITPSNRVLVFVSVIIRVVLQLVIVVFVPDIIKWWDIQGPLEVVALNHRVFVVGVPWALSIEEFLKAP